MGATTIAERVGTRKLVRVSGMLRAVAHPQRLAILDLLGSSDRLCVSEMQERLGIEQAILSQHLAFMREKGLVHCVREGRYGYYRLQHPEFLGVIGCLEHCCGGL